MDEESAATAADELVPIDALERHLAGEEPSVEIENAEKPRGFWGSLFKRKK